jgi:hypothetical protein
MRLAAPLTLVPLATSTETCAGERGGAVVVVGAAVWPEAAFGRVVAVDRGLRTVVELSLGAVRRRMTPMSTASPSSAAPRRVCVPAERPNDPSPAA